MVQLFFKHPVDEIKGLKTLDFLMLLQEHQILMRSIFVPNSVKLDAMVMQDMYFTHYSSIGSNQREKRRK